MKQSESIPGSPKPMKELENKNSVSFLDLSPKSKIPKKVREKLKKILEK